MKVFNNSEFKEASHGDIVIDSQRMIPPDLSSDLMVPLDGGIARFTRVIYTLPEGTKVKAWKRIAL